MVKFLNQETFLIQLISRHTVSNILSVVPITFNLLPNSQIKILLRKNRSEHKNYLI